MKDEQVATIVAIVKAWYVIEDVNVEISYMADKKQFRVVCMTRFPMPDDEGGYYWEEEVACIDFYNWETDVDVLSWVLNQRECE